MTYVLTKKDIESILDCVNDHAETDDRKRVSKNGLLRMLETVYTDAFRREKTHLTFDGYLEQLKEDDWYLSKDVCRWILIELCYDSDKDPHVSPDELKTLYIYNKAKR